MDRSALEGYPKLSDQERGLLRRTEQQPDDELRLRSEGRSTLADRDTPEQLLDPKLRSERVSRRLNWKQPNRAGRPPVSLQIEGRQIQTEPKAPLRSGFQFFVQVPLIKSNDRE